MKVLIGCDHAGFDVKEHIREFLMQTGMEFKDFTPTLNPDDDYPEVAAKLGRKAVLDGCFGILVCGTGLGICMAANKIKGVRAATCRNAKEAHITRADNNANILCLGGREEKNYDDVFSIIDAFLRTPFAGEKEEGARHKRRVEKISLIESKEL